MGGSTARSLAAVLADLAKTHQVIVVTHLAQVAVMGECHYLVSKGTGVDGKPEIARMLSGDASEISLEHARELLAETRG